MLRSLPIRDRAAQVYWSWCSVWRFPWGMMLWSWRQDMKPGLGESGSCFDPRLLQEVVRSLPPINTAEAP